MIWLQLINDNPYQKIIDLSNYICIQIIYLHGIKYFYLIQIICAQLSGFKQILFLSNLGTFSLFYIFFLLFSLRASCRSPSESRFVTDRMLIII